MISCAEYRRQLLAEPDSASPLLLEHRRSCAACADFTRQLQRFESRLRNALNVELVPRGSADVLPLARRHTTPKLQQWLAVAASIAGVIGIASFLWIGSARQSLASAVVDHMAHEPQAWAVTDERVSASQLTSALKDAHVRLGRTASRVSYARSCLFRLHHVPHLVVQTESGPVTVMVLAHEKVRGAERFDEGGYQGMLLPVPDHGSLAVIMRGATEAQVQRVADTVMREVQWLP
ncbi:MAG: DUF3379 family protein [Proteobacteria bacterium]|nr:DUF3379 family protein [Pseudomonadota bacterium]